MVENKCLECKYVEPYSDDLGICNCRESPFYNQEVGLHSYCECFVNNPAQDYLASVALTIMEDEESHIEGITNLEQALQLGLPSRDEVICRTFLAGAYLNTGIEDIPSEHLTGSEIEDAYEQNDKITNGIDHFEKALTLDAENVKKIGEKYADPLMDNFFLRDLVFSKIEIAYALRSGAIKRRKYGIDSAISYLQEKLRLLDYLPGTWMSNLYLELGILYAGKKQYSLAAINFKKAIEADTDYPEKMKMEDEYHQGAHEMAQHNLRILAQDPKATTELRKEEKVVKKEIDRLRQSITDELTGAGIAAYALFSGGEMKIEDKKVQEALDQIRSIDEENNGLTHQMEELRAQQPKGGFLSRLKDKASSTAKTATIQLDLRSKHKKKEQIMPILGERIYSCYKKGESLPSALQQIWETVDELKKDIKQKEAGYSSLDEALKTLELDKTK